MPTERDYDTDPDRYRLGMSLADDHRVDGADLYARILRLLLDAGVEWVLDAGCGSGALAARARGTRLRVVNLDAAETMAAEAARHGPAVRGELTRLPLADGSVDAVVSVNVLDHLETPGDGLREAHRVLRSDGLFVAGTVSRLDAPELAPYWRPRPTPFDAEDAPRLVAEVFGSAESRPWDAPLVVLPDREAIRDFLRSRFVATDDAATSADALAERRPLPLPITKRGALVLARRS